MKKPFVSAGRSTGLNVRGCKKTPMSANHLIVIAEMFAKAGQEGELRTHLLALVEPTRKEEGCLRYDLHLCATEPGRFIFLETWTSREALDRHMQTAHFQAFAAGTKELLAGPPRILMCNQIA
jgi:quinol monooxygenase YgiN